jgi:hypothetical protein
MHDGGLNMKAITIRGVDDAMSERLRCAAKEAGKSVNQLLVEMIRREMGLEKPKRFTAWLLLPSALCSTFRSTTGGTIWANY